MFVAFENGAFPLKLGGRGLRWLSFIDRDENNRIQFHCHHCNWKTSIHAYTGSTTREETEKVKEIPIDVITLLKIRKHLKTDKHRYAELSKLFPIPEKPENKKAMEHIFDVNKDWIVCEENDYWCDLCGFQPKIGNLKTRFYTHLLNENHHIRRIEALIERDDNYTFDWGAESEQVKLNSEKIFKKDGFIDIHQIKIGEIRHDDYKETITELHFRCVKCFPPYLKKKVDDLNEDEIHQYRFHDDDTERVWMNEREVFQHLRSEKHKG